MGRCGTTSLSEYIKQHPDINCSSVKEVHYFSIEELFERVENGEHIGILGDNGHAAVMIPADDELIRIYSENNNEAP